MRLLYLESGQLDCEVVDGVEARLNLGHHALQRLRGQPGGRHLRKEIHSNVFVRCIPQDIGLITSGTSIYPITPV